MKFLVPPPQIYNIPPPAVINPYATPIVQQGHDQVFMELMGLLNSFGMHQPPPTMIVIEPADPCSYVDLAISFFRHPLLFYPATCEFVWLCAALFIDRFA
jgi:hypothetical protein